MRTRMKVPVEDRIALQDLMTEYCYAVDKLTDLDDLLNLFTDDAVLDFSDIGLQAMPGKQRFRPFYENVFADMTHHTHYISNFRPESYTGETAVMTAYAEGLGRSRDGNTVQVHVRYRMNFLKIADEWKISAYYILKGMPMPESLAEIHHDH